MKILFVMDQYDEGNNGITMSTSRFAQALEQRGHDIKVLAVGKEAPNKIVVPERHIPLATYCAHKQGLLFGDPVPEIVEKAIKDADIVHFLMPFKLSKKGLQIANKLGVPHTGAFHVQPENVTYNIGLHWSKTAANFVYRYFWRGFYRHCKFIHCPSQFIANQLIEHGYKSKIHVISNGIGSNFRPLKTEKPKEYKDKFIITMIGRLSLEKRQDVLMKAVSKSKYADKIQIIFAGKGPKENYYKKIGQKLLVNQPKFGFFKQEDLINMLGYSDLYVHPSDVEIEAIACIEAFATGLVPIICDSEMSATPQFARDERSLFKRGDIDELTRKIEYWYENQEERERMGKVYAEYAKEFYLEKCAAKMENMFEEAIETFKKGK